MPERRNGSNSEKFNHRCLLVINFILLFGSSVIEFTSATENFTCLDTETRALLGFKQQLNDPSGRLSSWVGLHCCQWHGVECNNRTGHVNKLDLRNPFPTGKTSIDESNLMDYKRSCLGGGISSSLVELKYLEYLDLSLNDFGGINIPQFFGVLKNLKYLNLSMASFAGQIPPHLGNLSNLNHLDLNSDSFVTPRMYELHVESLGWLSRLSSLTVINMGRVNINTVGQGWVDAINLLPSLVELRLGSCNLQVLPLSLPFVNFTSLSVLDLSDNSFNSSIPKWLNLTSLEYLDLSMNSFHSAIPGTFANLMSLKYLDLSGNGGIDGQLPGFLGKFCKLEVLNLSGNNFGGHVDELFVGFTGCPNSSLVSLDLSANLLTGKLPDSLGLLGNLQQLHLASNSFQGSIPASLGSLSALQELDISSNEMNGTIPPNINELMPRVKNLLLSRNHLNGMIPSSICSLRCLEVLSLRNNQLTGTLPHCWNESQPLWVLDIANNNISGTIPGSIGLLSSLNIFMLGNNSLVGEIPSSLQNCTALVSIDLAANKLSGQLPLWIGQRGMAFWMIQLRSNSFSGPIPTNWCKLSSLHILDLAHNNLSGVIPMCFGNLTSLIYNNSSTIYRNFFRSHKYYYMEQTILVTKGQELEYSSTLQYVNSIDLSGNNLIGGIPEGIANLTALSYLNLSRNHLTGSIPGDIGKIRWLETLDLSSNDLSGRIPEIISSLTMLAHLNLSHNSLVGRIPTGRQLQTLNDSSIFEGNPSLCGAFLSIKCPDDDETPYEDYEDSEVLWFWASMGSGFLVGVFGISCTLWMKKSWRNAYFRFAKII